MEFGSLVIHTEITKGDEDVLCKAHTIQLKLSFQNYFDRRYQLELHEIVDLISDTLYLDGPQ